MKCLVDWIVHEFIPSRVGQNAVVHVLWLDPDRSSGKRDWRKSAMAELSVINITYRVRYLDEC